MRVSLLTLLLVQAELIRGCPEPVHHLRTRWSLRLYSTTTTPTFLGVLSLSSYEFNFAHVSLTLFNITRVSKISLGGL